jgi:hypothetical protein
VWERRGEYRRVEEKTGEVRKQTDVLLRIVRLPLQLEKHNPIIDWQKEHVEMMRCLSECCTNYIKQRKRL